MAAIVRRGARLALVAGLALLAAAPAAQAQTVQDSQVPTNFRAVTITPSKVTVAWDPPGDSTNVSYYQSQIREDRDTAVWSNSATKTDRQRTFTAIRTGVINPLLLMKATWYQFRVASCSVLAPDEDDECSDWATLRLQTRATAPSAPGNVSASALNNQGNGNDRVRWDAPGDNGGKSITGYEIERRQAGQSFQTAVDIAANAMSHDFAKEDGTSGTAYDYRMRAHNGDEYSPWSDIVAVAGRPRGPTGLTATAAADRVAVELSWTAPSASDTGGKDLSSYLVQWREHEAVPGSWQGSDVLGSKTVDAPATGVTVATPDLAPDTQYDFRISAENEDRGSFFAFNDNTVTATTPLLSATVSATEPAPLTEGNLDGAKLTVDLVGTEYAAAASLQPSHFAFDLSGVSVAADGVDRRSDTRVMLTLAYDGTDFDSDETLAVTVKAAAHDAADLTTSTVPVTATVEVAPARVTGVTIVPRFKRLEVSWTPVPGATGYKVQWRRGTRGVYSEDREAATTEASYTIGNLLPNNNYWVRVAATTAGAPDDGPWSDEKRVRVPNFVGPADMQATAIGPTSVTLTFEDTRAAVSYDFRLQRRESGGQWSAGTRHPTPPVTVDGLTPDTTYEFRVALCSGTTCTANSSPLSVTTPVLPRLPHPDLEIAPGDGRLDLSWEAVSGATGYRIRYRCGAATPYESPPGQPVDDGTATMFAITGLANGTTCYVGITARAHNNPNARGSGWTVDAAATPAAPLGKPTSLDASLHSGQIVLLWPPVSGAGGYVVFWKETGGAYSAANSHVIGAGTDSTLNRRWDAVVAGTPLDPNAGWTFKVRAIRDIDNPDTDPASKPQDSPEATNDARSPGVTVSVTELEVGEGSTETYFIVLDSRPSADVTVTVTDVFVNVNGDRFEGDTGIVTRTPKTLTFTPTDWNRNKSVAVKAEQDSNGVHEELTLEHAATSADEDYEGLAVASVAVRVNDDDVTVGNNPPVFTDGDADPDTDDTTTRSFAENASAGVAVGDPVSATDPDNDRIDYSLEGADAASFAIDGGTGQIRTGAGVTYDYETQTSYSVEVVATDEHNARETIAVTIGVTDQPPPGRPAAPAVSRAAQSPESSLAAAWTAPANAGPAITDYDVRWREDGTSGAWTELDDTTPGTALTATVTDLDPGTTYEVQVRAESAEGGGDWSLSGTGMTLPANAPPVFQTTSFEVPENTTAVGTTIATDADPQDAVSAATSPVGPDAALFDLEISAENRGAATLTFKTAPDYENPADGDRNNVYEVDLAVTSGAGSRLRVETQRITVTVTDVDVPSAPGAPTVTATTAGSATLQWAASSDDGGSPVTSYSVEREGTNNVWILVDKLESPGTGTLTLKVELAPDSDHVLRVRARNSEGDSAPSATVTATTPKPTVSLAGVTVGEGGGRAMFEVTRDARPLAATPFSYATSVETGDTATLGVDFADASGNSSIQAGRFSRTLVVDVLQDAIAEGDETFTLTLSNLGAAARFAGGGATLTARGTITDDDRAAGKPTDLAAAAGSGPGEVDLTWTAPDPGMLDGVAETVDEYQYRSATTESGLSSATWTKTESADAAFTVAGVLPGEHWFQVRAVTSVTDADGNPAGAASDPASVTVANTDPTFTGGVTQTRSVPENTASGADIGDPVAATDADGHTLSYALGGTDAASFEIVPASGQLRTKAGVTYDHEAKSSYTVTVTAADGHGGTATATVTVTVANVDEDPSGAPTIEGTAHVGETLTAVTTGIDDPDGLTNPTFALQWIRVDGTTETDLAGRTSTTYALGTADLGKKIRVRATFTDDAGNEESLTSAATATVTVAPPGAPAGFDAAVPAGERDRTRNRIVLSWTAATDGGTLTGYKWEHTAAPADASSTWTTGGTLDATPTEATVTLAGAANAHTAFRLRATGAGGDGPPSAADEVAARPGAVADLASVLAQPEQVTLSWSAATTGGKPVTYHVQRRPATSLNDRLWGWRVDETTGMTTWTDERSGERAAFSYRVRAENDDRDGPWTVIHVSGRPVFRDDHSLRQQQPVATPVPGRGDRMTLRWKVPNDTPRGSTTPHGTLHETGPVTSFLYQWREAGAGSWTNEATEARGSRAENADVTVTVMGLRAGTRYQFRVRADTDTRLGIFSKVAEAATVATATIAATNPAALTEADLHGATLTVDLDGSAYRPVPVPTGAFAFSPAVAGLRVVSVDRQSDTRAVLTLAFNGDLTADTNLSVVVGDSAHTGSESLTAGPVAVTAAPGGPAWTLRLFRQGTEIARVDETDADRTVTVQARLERGSGTETLPATVALAYGMSGTASRPDDYTGTLPALARQADGDRAVADIAFTIKGDDRDEPDETIVLSAAVGDRTFTATLTIADDDVAPATVPGRPGLSVTKPPGSGFDIHLNITAPASDGGSPITGYQCQVRLVSSTQWTDALHSVCRTGGDLFNPAGVFSADEDSILRVRARNAVGPGPWAHARLNRHGPQNNRAPSFTEGSSTMRMVAENAPVGSDVGAPVTATDADIGGTGDPDDALAYRLSGADAGAFAIDAATGQIATRTAFDRTMKIDYAVTVRVADLFGGSDAIAVAIAVTEAILNTPATGKPAISGIAEEGQELRADVSGIMDADGLTDPVWDYRWIRVAPGGAETETAGPEGAGAVYAVTSDDVGGTLRVRVRFQDDRRNDEELASDPTATVAANAPPAFTSDATFSVPENSTAVGTVVAEDADLQDAVAYAITGGADMGRFSITSDGGVLSFDDGPDFEAPADVESASPANAAGNNEYVVTVTATSGTGHRAMSATQDITVTVTNADEPPLAPAAPTVAAVTFESLDVQWAAPNNTGRPTISGYDLRYQPTTADEADDEEWTDGPQDQSGSPATIPGLDAGVAYRVQVRAVNADGDGGWSDSSAPATTHHNRPPAFAADTPATVDVPENTTTVTMVTATDPDEQETAVTYSLGGTDADQFSIGTDGAIVFDPAPDFEAPADDGKDNVYDITVIAGSGTGNRAMSATHAIAVTVTNENEAPVGTVTISGTAEVEQTLTADTSGITDPDGLTSPSFALQWIRVDGATATDIAGQTGTTYTLAAGDLGKQIRVRATFTDDGGFSNTLVSAATATVAAPPPRILLDVESPLQVPEGESVAYNIRLDNVPAGGVTVTATVTGSDDVGIGPQRVRSFDFNFHELISTSLIGIRAADGSAGETATVTHTFPGGDPVALSVEVVASTATVPDAPGNPRLAVDGDDVVFSWDAPENDGGRPVLRYEYGYRTPSATAETIEPHLSTSVRSVRIALSSAGDAGTTFRVRAVNVRGAGDWSAAATLAGEPGAVAGLNAAGGERRTPTPADNVVDLSWSAPSSDGGEPITGYEYQWKRAGGSWSGAPTVTTATAAAVTGVSDAAAHDFRVRARNALRPGQWIGLRVSHRPAAPAGVVGTPRSTGTGADLTWNAVTAATAVVRYRYQWRPVTPANAAWQSGTVDAPATAGAATGLDANREYEFRVRAETAHRDGAWSAALEAEEARARLVSCSDTPPRREGGIGTTLLCFRLKLDRMASVPFAGSWALSPQSTAGPDDYTAPASMALSILAGDTMADIRLTIADDAIAEGRECVRLTVTKTAPTSDTLIRLTDPEEEICFGDDGDAAAGKPTGLSAAAGAAGEVDLAWTAPGNRGRLNFVDATIDDYQVRTATTKAGLATAAWTDTDSAGTSHTVTGLAAGTHWFQVRAVTGVTDADGDPAGAASDAASATVTNAAPVFTDGTTQERSVPENAAAGTDIGVAVAATDTDGHTLSYTLDGTDAASFEIVSASGQLRTMSGVTYDHETKSSYTVTVTADDGNGGTAVATVTVTVTDVNEAPGAPAAPTFGTKTLASLVVNWQAPATNTGPAITDYDVRYYAGSADPANEADWTELDDTTPSTVLTATIPGLTAGTAYRVQVRAENAEGAGTWSQSGAATTTLASLAIDSPTVTEGDSGTATLTFTVRLSPASGQQVTVAWADAGTGTAESGTDYAALGGGTLTFAPNETSKTIAVSVTGDTADEPDETVVIELSNPSNATLAGGVSTLTGAGTISDDDPAPVVTLVLTPAAVSENGGVSTVTATLDRASSETTTVTVSAAAVAPAVSGDFTLSANRVLTVAAGATASTGTVTVTGVDNSLDAPDRTVTVSATATNGLGVTGPSDVTLTLTDDDGASALSIDSPRVAEGDSGTATLTFAVTLAPASGQQVTVAWADAGTGTATPGTDYAAIAGGTLTFAPNETSKTIAVTVTGDRVDEPDETVVIELSNPANATLGTATGTGTIEDDDPAPVVTLVLAPATVSENGEESTVTATLDRASSEATTVTVSAAAVAPAVSGDFALSANRVLTVAAGATASTGTVTVTGVDNSLDAPDRTVTVSATASNSQGVTDPADVTLTLTDDDGASALSIDSPSVTEGDSGSATLTFAVTLAPASGQQVTVAWADAGTGTATPGTDYAAIAGGTLTFAPNETSKTIAVTVTGDRVDEPDETVVLTLSNPSHATLGTATGTGTITDDDPAPVVTLVLTPATVSENGGVSTVTATLDRASSEATTVTVSATAVSPAMTGDFTLSANTVLTIAAGATASTGTVTLTGVDNSLDAPDKTVSVSATATNGLGVTGPDSVTLTLTDDDGASALSIDSPTVTEGDSGTTTLTFTVTLLPASGQQVTVDWADADTGTAESGTDYTALTAGRLTFAPTETSKTIAVIGARRHGGRTGRDRRHRAVQPEQRDPRGWRQHPHWRGHDQR